MKQTTIRITTGLIVTAVGVGALLDALNIIPFWSWFGSWWPSLLIIGGILALVSDIRQNYLWGGVLVIIGGTLLLRLQDIVDINIFSLIVPIIIIAIGLSLTGLIGGKKFSSPTTETKNTDDITAIFGGSETKNKSKKYAGGKVTAIFGAATIDLRDAKLSDQASLNVTTLFGGVELRVPREWKVVSKIAPIAGGVENKSEGSDDHSGPVLVLTGVAICGGVEIKT